MWEMIYDFVEILVKQNSFCKLCLNVRFKRVRTQTSRLFRSSFHNIDCIRHHLNTVRKVLCSAIPNVHFSAALIQVFVVNSFVSRKCDRISRHKKTRMDSVKSISWSYGWCTYCCCHHQHRHDIGARLARSRRERWTWSQMVLRNSIEKTFPRFLCPVFKL